MKLPDYVTSLNLVCGLVAVFASINGHTATACLFILAGVVFDAFDGYIARKMHIESDFGAELDSLADLVTFGVAPMLVIMTIYSGRSFEWLAILAALLPLCGALRLARHNINRNNTKGFLIGIPITTCGFVIPILAYFSPAPWVTAIALLALSFGMLSTVRVNKLFK